MTQLSLNEFLSVYDCTSSLISWHIPIFSLTDDPQSSGAKAMTMDSKNSVAINVAWSRPPGPIKIWNTFDGKNKDGTTVRFTLQEIPEDRYEEAVDSMITDYLADEALNSSLNMRNDPIAVENFRSFWTMIINEGMSIGAFIENKNGPKPILAGLNILAVESKNDNVDFESLLKSTSKSFEKVFVYSMVFAKAADVYTRYGVDKYLSSMGLVVKPAFRRFGLGTRILKAREQICKEYGIQVTSTFFSSTISQKGAENAGLEVLLEKNYNTALDEKGQLLFPDIKSEIGKIQAKKYY